MAERTVEREKCICVGCFLCVVAAPKWKPNNSDKNEAFFKELSFFCPSPRRSLWRWTTIHSFAKIFFKIVKTISLRNEVARRLFVKWENRVKTWIFYMSFYLENRWFLRERARKILNKYWKKLRVFGHFVKRRRSKGSIGIANELSQCQLNLKKPRRRLAEHAHGTPLRFLKYVGFNVEVAR